MKNVWRIFLLLMVLNDLSLITSEPQYQQQQNQLIPQGNFNIVNNNNNNVYGPQQQPQQQLQQQQQQQQPPYQYRAPPPPTTAAPSFFQRITSWFNFFGDDSDDRRPLLPLRKPPATNAQPPPPQQQLQPQPQPFQPPQQQPPFQPPLQQPIFQQQQQPQFPTNPQLVHFPQQQQNVPILNGSRIGLVTSNYVSSGFNNPQPNGGFQPIIHQNHNYQTSGSNYHPVANALPPNNNIQSNGYQYPPPSQKNQQPQTSYVPSTLQQQVVGSQQDPRILRPSQPHLHNSQHRDPEPITISPGVALIPGVVPILGAQNPDASQDFDYHPCNNVPWVPLAPPPGSPPVTQVPLNAIPEITPPNKRPIKLEIKPKGQVHSEAPYPPSIQNHEPTIITAAPPPQHLIHLQLQQQQQQLQNLQLQQLQLQQQQLQQQLHQLQVASSSSHVYTTVAYANEDSKPAASEHRNVTFTGTNQLSADEEEDYSSEEESDQISGVTVTFPVEVTSVVPKTRYYSSRTTTTERPTTFPSSLPPPTDPGELGNGLQIIYSASQHTSSPPVNNKHLQRQLPDSDLDHPDLQPPVSLFNNLLSDDEDPIGRETVPITVPTHAPPTRPASSILTTLKVTANRPTFFQRFTVTEAPVTEITTPIPHTVTTVPPTTSSHLSSMTAAIGGHINTSATKKPKQIQIIIPYSTYKKPEPFKPKDHETDHAPEPSNTVISTTGSTTTPVPTKSHFVTRESMKFFHSTTNIKDILRKETTRPFSRPPTAVPEKPTKLKKVEPVKVSKDSKPFTPARVPKMTPMPPVFNLTGLSADHRLERTTTLPPRTFRPTIIMAHPSKFAPNYINITRMRPTSHTYSPRTTISQLLRTTKIFTKPPKFHDDLESRPLPPAIYRRTTVSTTTTERPETTPIPIYERNEWDIDPLLLQRRIDTWTEQQYASDDYLFKTSTIPLHRVTKAIPWEFLTTTMLPSLRDRTKGRDSWRNVKIAISPHTKEKVYVVTPQPWTAVINQETVSSPRFSIRPTPFYQKNGGSTVSSSNNSSRSGSTRSTVDVSPESVNDLVEHKSKLHRPTLSLAKLKHRKYVRQKIFTRAPFQSSSARSSSSSTSNESA
ncbi:ataxin-2 homolog [Armigeres subalbatus]|uniref:ataxin-2 homolog n=1 Tax=Armigeres subalbatus TaxID=124917 RepID=UPI002ED5C128